MHAYASHPLTGSPAPPARATLARPSPDGTTSARFQVSMRAVNAAGRGAPLYSTVAKKSFSYTSAGDLGAPTAAEAQAAQAQAAEAQAAEAQAAEAQAPEP